MEFDESAYVEAPKGKTSLLFDDEKQQARFELGCSMMVYKWDALDIAVENQWGGPDSAEKRDWITGIIVDLFKSEKLVDVALIEETLLYAMVDEFDTNVEDDSALPIASGVIDVYNACLAGNYQLIEKLYLEWQDREKNKPQRVIKVTAEDGDSSEDEEDEDEDEDEDVVQYQYEEVDVEMDEENDSKKPEPVVDDDGFELVQKKGKKRY